MKLGCSTRAVSPDAPRLRPITKRLSPQEEYLAEAEQQRDRSYAAWQACPEDAFLERVYQDNVACVNAAKKALGRA